MIRLTAPFPGHGRGFRLNPPCPFGWEIRSSGSMNEAEEMKTCGEDGIRRIVAAFYRRVTADDLLGPLYPADQIGAAEERLANFLLSG